MNEYNNENIYSKRLRAGKRRTYFFDVRTTKNNDYFVTLTESKKRYDSEGYDRHKIFLYKEDFNKFLEALTETINHVKTELMPDFDFDAFNYDDEENQRSANVAAPQPDTSEAHAGNELTSPPASVSSSDVSDKAAEELSPKLEESSFNTTGNQDKNPTANDEAETW